MTIQRYDLYVLLHYQASENRDRSNSTTDLFFLSRQPSEPKEETNLKKAVDLWCNNKEKAQKKYGHISEWDVSLIQFMQNMFYEKEPSKTKPMKGYTHIIRFKSCI